MTVGTTLRGWSATAANNSPKGTDVIGTSADDELRQIQATVRQYLASQSSTVAPSAGVADLTTATGHWVPISGSSTITGLGSEDAGIEYVLSFTGAPTLVNSSALALPGAATIVGATNDVCIAESLGSGNWRIWGYTRANASPTKLPTRTVLTSGSSATYTTPTGATRINVRMVGGGGGGAAATANNGTAGNDSSFGTLTASGGSGGIANGGAGGAGGASSNGDINIPGGNGQGGGGGGASGTSPGGSGGNSAFGGGGGGGCNLGQGNNAATNSGGGGGGGGSNTTNSGGGGGGGGYVEKLIAPPSSTYTYTVGAAANGGAAGTLAGGNGAAGIIIVDEFYN